MRKPLAAAVLAGALALTAVTAPAAVAAGEGPNYGGNETVNTSILHTYEELAAELEVQDAKQPRLDVDVIGQTVKGRDIFLDGTLSAALSFSSVLSLPYVLDELVPQLAAAVDGDPETTA